MSSASKSWASCAVVKVGMIQMTNDEPRMKKSLRADIGLWTLDIGLMCDWRIVDSQLARNIESARNFRQPKFAEHSQAKSYESKNSLRYGRWRAWGIHRRGASHRGGHGSADRPGLRRVFCRPGTLEGQRHGFFSATGSLLRHVRGNDQSRGEVAGRRAHGFHFHCYAEPHALSACEDGAGEWLPCFERQTGDIEPRGSKETLRHREAHRT